MGLYLGFYFCYNNIIFNLVYLESRWDPPAEGYMSIHQQKMEQMHKEEKEKLKAEKAEKRRLEIIEQQRAIHSKQEEVVEGPMPRSNPYGSWQTVENV